MNTARGVQALTGVQGFVQEARKITWKNIEITDRDRLRTALLMKHGSLTSAAETLSIEYVLLSHIVGGRRYPIESIKLIQYDLGLSNNQVLKLWPLLRTWPKKSRIAV